MPVVPKFKLSLNVQTSPGCEWMVEKFLSAFGEGKSLEETLFSKGTYFDRTEYIIHFETNLGIAEIIFKVGKNLYGGGIFLGEPDKDGITISIKSEGSIMIIDSPQKRDFHYVTSSSTRRKIDEYFLFHEVPAEIKNIKLKLLKIFVKGEFYLGPPMTEEQLRTLAEARKILEMVGRTTL